MKNKAGVIWGIVLVIAGILLGGSALGLFKVDIFFKGWWTLFIIVPCFVSLFTEGRKGAIGNLIGIAIGVSLLLASQEVISFDMLWKLLVPAIIIILGLSLIFKTSTHKDISVKIKEIEGDTDKDETVAVFSGQKVKVTETFKAKELTAVFGGIDFDMRDVKLKEDVAIEADAIFGGITIFAPEGVNVEVCSTSLFGGASDKRESSKKDEKKTPTIYIDATAVFGGVEIK